MYLARHTQSEDNANRIISGRTCNPVLTNQGIEQAQLLAEKILNDLRANGRFAFGFSIHHSSLVRTQQVAEILSARFRGERHVIGRLYRSIFLDEVHVGSYEGQHRDVLAQDAAQNPLYDLKQPNFDFRDVGGESADDAFARFYGKIKRIQADQSNLVTIVIAHGSIIRLTGARLGKNFEHPQGEYINILM